MEGRQHPTPAARCPTGDGASDVGSTAAMDCPSPDWKRCSKSNPEDCTSTNHYAILALPRADLEAEPTVKSRPAKRPP